MTMEIIGSIYHHFWKFFHFISGRPNNQLIETILNWIISGNPKMLVINYAWIVTSEICDPCQGLQKFQTL